MQDLTLATLQHLLSLVVPFIDEEFAKIDESNGWIKLPEVFLENLTVGKFPWWQFYASEKQVRALGFAFAKEMEEFKGLFDAKAKDDLYRNAIELAEIVDHLPPLTEFEKRELQNQFNSASFEEQVEQLIPLCKAVLVIASVFFNYLALMVHGRTMCQLVADAKSGNDDAFHRAVHIDRSVLRLDYFQDRLMRAQFSGDQDFWDKLSYRLKSPPLKSKIKYKTLFLVFFILDDEGFLDSLSLEELFDFCQKLGVYGESYGIQDIDHLRKRLSDYRKLQRN